jgi:uncharacterized membrane protein YuzA (DUF378 family)
MMHHHSPILNLLCKATWLITALAAIHMGLAYFNINLMMNLNVMRFMPYINLVVGVAGVASLLMLVMHFAHAHKCDCGKGNNCTCKC